MGGRGEGGLKIGENSERNLWMAPYITCSQRALPCSQKVLSCSQRCNQANLQRVLTCLQGSYHALRGPYLAFKRSYHVLRGSYYALSFSLSQSFRGYCHGLVGSYQLPCSHRVRSSMISEDHTMRMLNTHCSQRFSLIICSQMLLPCLNS